MTRTAAKLLLSAAVLGGLCLAAAGSLNAGSADLPAAPTAVAPASAPTLVGADGNLVVDLKDWQKTRVTSKTSNITP